MDRKISSHQGKFQRYQEKTAMRQSDPDGNTGEEAKEKLIIVTRRADERSAREQETASKLKKARLDK